MNKSKRYINVGVSTGGVCAQLGTDPLTSGGMLNDPSSTADNLWSSRIGFRWKTVGSVEVGVSFNLQIFVESSPEIAKSLLDLAKSSLDLRRNLLIFLRICVTTTGSKQERPPQAQI